MKAADFTTWLKDTDRRCLVMGVLNVTPDSFSDGGLFFTDDSAIAAAEQMYRDGADLIDVGGESTRPGSARVDPAEQIRRVLPVLRSVGRRLPVVLSVDTTRAEVARAALDAGATVINDISAARDDADMLPLMASSGAAAILMHMQGRPADMQLNPAYRDVTDDVMAFLRQRLEAARDAGIPPDRILLDPGIGFGKALEHNLQLLGNLPRLAQLRQPLVVGVSRKSFIGRITGQSQPAQRIFGTAASVAWSAANGAAIVRVHDVKAMSDVVRTIRAIQAGHLPDNSP